MGVGWPSPGGAVKAQPCRELWCRRRWRCPSSNDEPGEEMPNIIVNGAPARLLPNLVDNCYECGSYDVQWHTAGMGASGECQICGSVQP